MRFAPTSAARTMCALALALAALDPPLALGRDAWAQTDPSAQRAREIFKKSEQSYRDGRFQEAVDLLTEAYRLDPKPVLLYNMARAYEGLGDNPRALDAYRRYLQSEPHAPDRGALEQRIATLERQQEEREALERQRDAAAREKHETPPPPQPVEPPRSPSAVPWVVAGVGVAGIGAGIVLGLLARGRHADAVDSKDATKAIELQDGAERLATGANIALIAGGAMALGAGIWGIVDLATLDGGARAAAPRIGVALGARGLYVRGAF